MIGGNGQVMPFGTPGAGMPSLPTGQNPQTMGAQWGQIPQPYQQPQQGALNPFAMAFAPGGMASPYQQALAGLTQPPPQQQGVQPVAPTAPAQMPTAQTPYTAQSIAALISMMNGGAATPPAQMPVYQQPAAVTAALNAPLAAAEAAKQAPAAAAATAPVETVTADVRENAGGEREMQESGDNGSGGGRG